MTTWSAAALGTAALLVACAPANECVARMTTESGTPVSATYRVQGSRVSVQVVHALPSIRADRNQDEAEIDARAGRMREFARSRAELLCRDRAYEVLSEELGVFGGLLTRALGVGSAAMARDTTLDAEYYCSIGPLGG
jgi:hypothetical protein